MFEKVKHERVRDDGESVGERCATRLVSACGEGQETKVRERARRRARGRQDPEAEGGCAMFVQKIKSCTGQGVG
eukprot:6207304-Pleurochrysis_carterae.AAC.1